MVMVAVGLPSTGIANVGCYVAMIMTVCIIVISVINVTCKIRYPCCNNNI